MLFNRGVVVELYGLPSLITAIKSLKSQWLQLKESRDIIVELEGLVA